ncbi:type II toxin-antitoxin system Phd/YefM family antitoxin [Mycobacteroides abscessus]|uniref:type II toxin-antitoxin system Phd/YefM family antitoxin n=1 Tax=Mycobacteroides abscessus TaxID=36809 RepID=UPI0009A88A16|nr:type II toxin-antitoxin system prevent-host-death family antitoxin [Mycobacteroides abscessus]
MERIGVRELRQNASKYLEKVQQGQTVEITDRGRLVAHLIPAVITDQWAALIASGEVKPAAASRRTVLDRQPRDFGAGAVARMRQAVR